MDKIVYLLVAILPPLGIALGFIAVVGGLFLYVTGGLPWLHDTYKKLTKKK